MTIQWALISGLLYAEISFVLLLLMPIFSPQKWQRFFKSKLMQAVTKQASWYFYFTIFILILFLLEAIREIRKYADVAQHTDHSHSHLDTEMQTNMRLFRAQRNFYICGFALFLCLVIRRLVSLITQEATLVAKFEAAMKQAEGANRVAREYLAGKKSTEPSNTNDADDNEMTNLTNKINTLEEALEKEKKDKEAIKSQASNISKEYDRLTEEHRKLQETVGATSDKKHE